MSKAVGIIEIAVGIALTFTGLGAIVGVPLIAAGASTLLASRMTANVATGTKQAPQAAMVTDTDAYGNVVYGEALVGGILLYRNTTGANNELLDYVIVHAYTRIESDGSCLGIQGFGDLYIDDNKIAASDIDASGNVTAGQYSGFVQVWRYDGTQTAADSTLVAAYGSDPDDPWLSTDILKGVVYTHIRFKGDVDDSEGFKKAFGGNAPQKVQAVIQGEKVYSPASATTAYSTTNALCVRDFMTRSDNGCGFPASVVDDTITALSATECDETITYPGTSRTGPRFTCNGVVTLSSQRGDIVGQMLASMAGEIIQAGGMLGIYSGSFTSSSGDIDDSFLRGGASISVPTQEDRYNYVTASFIDKNSAYQQVAAPPYPAIGSATYTSWTTEDGYRIDKSITLNFVNNADNAQVIEQIVGNKSRFLDTLALECNPRGIIYKVGDRVNATFPELGLDAVLYKIVQMQQLEDYSVNMALIRDDSSIYGFDNTIAREGPLVTFADPRFSTPPTPTGLTATAVADGIALSWTGAALHRAAHYQVWRATSEAGTYVLAHEFTSGTTWTDPITDGVSYWYKVRATNGYVFSAFSGAVNATAKTVENGATAGAPAGTPNQYSDGTDVNALRPGEAGADVTANNAARTVVIPDTRSVDSDPSYYRGLGIGLYLEFKDRSALGWPGVGNFVLCYTEVKWGDVIGGVILQWYSDEANDVWQRIGAGDDSAWGAWGHVENGADVTGNHTSNDVLTGGGRAVLQPNADSTAINYSLADLGPEQNFSAFINGFTPDVGGMMYYRVSTDGKQVIIYLKGQSIQKNSGSDNFLQITNLPAAIQSSFANSGYCVAINGLTSPLAQVQASGSAIGFSISKVVGSVVTFDPNGWTTTENKGLPGDFSFQYSL